MRDPKRIPKVLEAIQELWKKNPDWRLGQLLINVIDSSNGPTEIFKIWNLEDEDLLEKINHKKQKK
jgi:uncharacterized protein YihD (DUF1040 family)